MSATAAPSQQGMLTFGLQLLGVIGLDPHVPIALARRKFYFVVSFAVCVITMGTLQFLWSSDKMQAFHDGAESIIGAYQVFVKVIALFFARRKLRKLISKVSALQDIGKLEGTLGKELRGTREKVMKVAKFYFRFYCLTLAVLCSRPLMVKDERTLPYPIYDFANVYESPMYEVVYFLECVGAGILAVAIGGWDLLVYSFVAYIYCELEVVKHEFQSLKVNDEGDLQVKFAEVVRRHEFVLSCIPDLNSVCAMTMLNQFITLVGAICASVYVLAGAGHNVPLQVEQMLILLAVSTQLLCASCAGTILTDQSKSVGTALFHAPFWLEAPIAIKKEVVMVIQRSQKYEGLSMAGMGDINIPLFTKILKLSFSLANAILAIDGRKPQ
ncbi:odorant receptor 82a-like isoform X2 [Photinus pyralis]|uniref:odorant receptor 82a-like isoform X2 n=1 Tax=Photinus pyralis TaxID=7054 RepID=UPI00126762B0|nr:odorant receptor 82a-like isoform X2 [Photinus pyralis]